MKAVKYFFAVCIITVAATAVLPGCGDDSTSNNNGTTQTTFKGAWQVESAQMVEAPSGSGISATMKQALVPFGLMSASSVGYCNVNFGDSTWDVSGNITNSVLRVICDADDSLYTANGLYTTSGNTIAFVVLNYSGPHGNQNTGSGTYSLTTRLTIDLLLSNNEKWKINLKR